MKSDTANRPVAASVLACAALLGAELLASPPAAAQAPAPQNCAITGSTPGGGSTQNASGPRNFACVIDFDGNGTSELVIGNIFGDTGANGWVLYLNINGGVRKKLCWGLSCASIPGG